MRGRTVALLDEHGEECALQLIVPLLPPTRERDLRQVVRLGKSLVRL